MGKLLPKAELRVLATLAFLGFAAVFFMRSQYTTGVDTFTLVLPTLLQGIPMALFFVPLTAIILPACRRRRSRRRLACRTSCGSSLARPARRWPPRCGTIARCSTTPGSRSRPARAIRAITATLESIQSAMHLSPDQAVAFFERG